AAPAACPPEPDARYLRNARHVEHRPEDRIIEWNIFNRVLGRRHRLRELARPLCPCGLSPEIIDPQEAALLEVQPETRRFLVGQSDRADVRRPHKRAVE